MSTISLLGCSTTVASAMGPTEEEEEGGVKDGDKKAGMGHKRPNLQVTRWHEQGVVQNLYK